jgi:hypothetical protein
MRALLIAVAAALLVPASASAAPFGELPFQSLSRGAGCMRATGMPGEIVSWTPIGARMLHATPAGFTAPTMLNLGTPRGCPVAAAQPNGAGVVAVATAGAISVVLREPGASWAAPATLAVPEEADVEGLATAVSERGDAVVIWNELTFDRRGISTRVRVAKRLAGAAFGAPQTLTSSDAPPFGSAVGVGVAADGTAIAGFMHVIGSERTFRSVADVAIAAPGAPFGAGQRLTSTAFSGFALKVSADGRALAAFGDGGRVRIAERAPGGAFGPAQTVGTGLAPQLTVALGSGAEAVVAWRDQIANGITYARRADASGFGPPIELVPDFAGGYDESGEFLGGGTIDAGVGDPILPSEQDGTDLRAAIAAGGRVVLTWGDDRSRGAIDWRATHVATVDTVDRVDTQVLSGPLRDAGSISPVLLENGTAAVVWGDNRSTDGRAHLAIEGAAAAPPPALEVRVGKPERTVLRRGQPLVLPVTCSAACDIRADARGLSASASLTRAGTVRLQFLGEKSAAPLHAARVPITVLSGPAGSREATTQVVRPRLRRIPDPPMPRIAGLTAIRDGSAVVVTWNTTHSARDADFLVSPQATDRERSQVEAGRIIHGSAQRSYQVRFPKLSTKAHYIRVEVVRHGISRHAVTKIR